MSVLFSGELNYDFAPGEGAKWNLRTLDFHSVQGGEDSYHSPLTHHFCGEGEQCSTPKIKAFFVKPFYLLPPLEYHTHFFRALGSLGLSRDLMGKHSLSNYKKPSYLY